MKFYAIRFLVLVVISVVLYYSVPLMECPTDFTGIPLC